MNKKDLKAFIKNALKEIKEGSNACYYYHLKDNYYYVIQASDSVNNYDQNEAKLLLKDDTNKYIIMGKIATNCSDLQCDYDYDWEYVAYERAYPIKDDIDRVVESIKLELRYI